MDLESTLGLRPIGHRLDWRILGHQLTAVLAYHAMHLSWASIRNRRANCVQITTSLQEVRGSRIRIRQDVRPDAAAFEISRAAGMVPRLHRHRIRSKDAQNVQSLRSAVPTAQTHSIKPFLINRLQELYVAK
ncbi:MAG: hypothetical protein OXN97_04435 [Bryobacterales bacterium]|nr:hypothetical protein [Bryobacterales bacterium]MDE0627555.1 hypothetical protein [Bryobacterales bacterium]